MNLETVNTCINCQNLLRDFMCKKHEQTVAIDNSCDSHIYQDSLKNDSSCSNCSHFGKISCSKPNEASSGMLCFDWNSEGYLRDF